MLERQIWYCSPLLKWPSFVLTLSLIDILNNFYLYIFSLPTNSSGGGYHGYDESYGSPPYEGRRMGPPMRGRGGRSYGPGYGPPPPPPGEYGAHAESPVVMVYGLDPLKMNADRVFNIFCLYGNVERVSTWEQKRHFGFCFVEVSQLLNTIQEVNVYNKMFISTQGLIMFYQGLDPKSQ